MRKEQIVVEDQNDKVKKGDTPEFEVRPDTAPALSVDGVQDTRNEKGGSDGVPASKAA
jgi:hypothetical protein